MNPMLVCHTSVEQIDSVLHGPRRSGKRATHTLSHNLGVGCGKCLL